MVLYENLFKALSSAKIQYIVAGGFAVNFHQIQRATMDLDLIIHLDSKNVLAFTALMDKLGYVPRVPVISQDLADPLKRKDWIENKNMLVFSFINPKLKFEVIDVFVQEFKPFAELDSKKIWVEAFGIKIPVVGVEDLIEMKEAAGREKDLFDISQLRKKLGRNGS